MVARLESGKTYSMHWKQCGQLVRPTRVDKQPHLLLHIQFCHAHPLFVHRAHGHDPQGKLLEFDTFMAMY